MVLVYNLKFLSRGELAFTHNGTHFVEPSKFNDQFQECPKRYLSFGFKTLECRFRDARYFRKYQACAYGSFLPELLPDAQDSCQKYQNYIP